MRAKEFINEFAPSGGGEEDNLHKYARMWYNGDESVQQKVEQILDRMGWEIGELESEEGGCFVIRLGDENGNSYIGFSPQDLTESVVNEKWSKKYKSSINCSNPKGFSQKAHCAGKKKNENFADGKNPQDKGDSKRHGVPTKASVSTLRKVAKQGGRKGQLAHWMANMKAGRAKNESLEESSSAKTVRAVEELKSALLAQKLELRKIKTSADKAYKLIHAMMSRVARVHNIKVDKLHDLWVKRYKEIPDTWIMHQ